MRAPHLRPSSARGWLAAADEPPIVPGDSDEEPARWRQRLSSIRVRIFVWYVALFALMTALTIFAVRTVLVVRLDERIDRELNQEVEELRSLSTGRDPETGAAFDDDIERIFEVFLERNIPVRNEVMLAIVDGEVVGRSLGDPPARLDAYPALMERWAAVSTTERGAVTVPSAGAVRYLAVPLRVANQSRGVFVVAAFRDLERAEIDEVLRIAALVAALALVLAAAVTWALADRVLEPVRSVTRAARAISDTDLSRRIPVSGADEVSMLAATFNRMLDRLETAFGSQRDFLDDVGHELRTPITIIHGHLELLDHADATERERTVDLVLDELDRMHEMVEDLLLLAKAERSDFLVPETVELADLTAETLAKAQTLGDRRWVIDATARAHIVADRHRLTQALVQLCQNAVQHTEPGTEIAVGSALHGTEAKLWVRDSGPGVTADEAERIFDRFARGDRVRREGAGLGLAIVRTIAESHGGRVDVDRAATGGAVFTITLPVDPEDVG